MRLGILSDTHDELARTRLAVQKLREAGAEALVHCGDLASPPIVAACAVLPCWFTFGNHDADSVPALKKAAAEFGAVCLGWGGVIELGGRRVGVVHGHMTTDMRRVLAEQPDFLLFGHAHFASDTMVGSEDQSRSSLSGGRIYDRGVESGNRRIATDSSGRVSLADEEQ